MFYVVLTGIVCGWIFSVYLFFSCETVFTVFVGGCVILPDLTERKCSTIIPRWLICCMCLGRVWPCDLLTSRSFRFLYSLIIWKPTLCKGLRTSVRRDPRMFESETRSFGALWCEGIYRNCWYISAARCHAPLSSSPRSISFSLAVELQLIHKGLSRFSSPE